jgi:cell division septum initiation protein DivIVA
MSSDPDQIRGQIEQTQQNLSTDVDALTEKVSPPRIVGRQVQRTRSAMNGIKDTIMGSTTEHTSSVSGAVGSTASSAKDTLSTQASAAADMASSAPEMARQRTRGNPLAAGLIAFGAGWLLSSLLPATEPEQQMASQVKDLATDKGRPVAQQLGQAGQEVAQDLRESAQQRAQTVKDTAADAASTVSDQAQSKASDVAGHAQEARGRVTEQAGPGGS